MEVFDIKQVRNETFKTDTTKNGDTAILFLIGDMDMTNPGELLTPYFKSFHKKLCATGIKKVSLDIHKLTFINSSSIKIILNWLINDVRPMEESIRYQVKLDYNKDLVWQYSAFKPLSLFVSECFSI